jgi:hypothetical protein
MRFSAERAVAGVVLAIGLGSFAALGWTVSKASSFERPLDIGDGVVLGVLAVFGAFCAWTGWRLYRDAPASAPAAQEGPAPSPARRVRLSQGCAAVGVLLLVASVLVPAAWYPVLLLFSGLALLAVSHALTPCVERLEQLRRARESLRQL